MSISIQAVKYYLTNFRTRQSYLIFQICQLLLSCIIILIALLSDDLFRQTIVLVMQLLLLLCMCCDLFVIRWLSEGRLFRNRRNIIDFVIVLVFAITFIFMCATENKVSDQEQYRVLVQTDDIIVISIIMARYVLQIVQMIRTIRSTKKNMDIQRNIKDVDLNKTPNSTIIESGNEGMQDEIIRKKLEERNKNRANISHQQEIQM